MTSGATLRCMPSFRRTVDAAIPLPVVVLQGIHAFDVLRDAIVSDAINSTGLHTPLWGKKTGQIPGGYKVLDANGQSLAYVYGRETKADANIAKVLTMDDSEMIKPWSVDRARLPVYRFDRLQ